MAEVINKEVHLTFLIVIIVVQLMSMSNKFLCYSRLI